MTVDDEELVMRQWRVEDEKAWQRISMPLSAVREMREVVLTAILLGDDQESLNQLLLSIYSLESRLLREALSFNRQRCLDLLMLDQRQSWREIRDSISAEGNYRLSFEFSQIAIIVKRLVEENFTQNTED